MESARSRLAEGKSLLKEISEDSYFYNVLEGEILLAEGHADKAVSLFENEDSVVFTSFGSIYAMVNHNLPFARDQLARAYLQSGELDKAIEEYERLTSEDRTKVHYRLIHPLYYYRVALLYEQKGWEGKAIESYEKFLDLWKDADEGLPEIEDAKTRHAALQN